jgi:hypothetical protein
LSSCFFSMLQREKTCSMLEDILGIVSSDLGVSFSTLGLESSSLNRSNLSMIFLWRLF